MRASTGLLFSFLGLVTTACGSGSETASSGGTGQGGADGLITGAGGSSAGGGGGHPGVTVGPGAGGGGGAGGGASCPATGPFDGPKLVAKPGAWTWVDFPGSKCRDGSPTGIGVRLNPASDKIFIYLEGGGACFNATTCAVSLTAFGKSAFDGWAASVGNLGIFDPNVAANPVKDWNAVYVPYCSGDVHIGDAGDVNVPGGPQKQQFVGYSNVGLYLQRIVPTFHDASQLLLTGVSAGGFGAAFNYDRVASAFCPVPVTLLDDSGPPMSDAYLAPCLQEQWKTLWALDKTIPAGCPACNGPDGGGIVNYATYLSTRWPNTAKGLISSTHDAVISTFFGFGSNDCKSSTPLDGPTYEAGLADLRDKYLSGGGNWGTYYVNSATHTYLIGPGFYTTVVGNKLLTDWVKELLAGQTSNVSP